MRPGQLGRVASFVRRTIHMLALLIDSEMSQCATGGGIAEWKGSSLPCFSDIEM